MNPELFSHWLESCFKAAREHKDGPMAFNLYEFPLNGVTPEQKKDFHHYMVTRMNAAAEQIISEYFDTHEELPTEVFVDAMKHQEAYHWQTPGMIPDYPSQTYIQGVHISVDCVMSIYKIKKDVNHRIQVPLFENQEFHVTAYTARERLKDEDLKKKHEELTIVCDEDSFYKKLPLNKVASSIAGIELRGDILFFLSRYVEQNEEEIYPDLEIKTMIGMLNTTDE